MQRKINPEIKLAADALMEDEARVIREAMLVCNDNYASIQTKMKALNRAVRKASATQASLMVLASNLDNVGTKH